MKPTLTLTAIIIIALAACNSPQKANVNYKGGIECEVYEGYPVTHDADFETEAVFIPVAESGIHSTGDTVMIEIETGFIRELPIRYMDGNHILTDSAGVMQVVIHDRVMPNKFVKIK